MTYNDKGKVAVGYSRDTSPNKEWETEGLVCEYEHCIENMPLYEEEVREAEKLGIDLIEYLKEHDRNPRSCPVFGHDCPGGEKRAGICKGLDADMMRQLRPDRVVA